MRLSFHRLRHGKKTYPDTAALIAAAGSGSRMEGACADKLFYMLGGVPVLGRTLLAFEAAETVSSIVVVARRDTVGDVYALARELNITKLSAVTAGGATRAESVKNGIGMLPEKAVFVTASDGARPFVTPELIDRVSVAAYESGAAAACVRVTDTLKQLNADAKISKTIDRERTVAMQTPQCFRLSDYSDAVSRLGSMLGTATDDCAVMEAAGHSVTPVFSDYFNIKITSPEDLVLAEAIAEHRFGQTVSK